MRNKHKDKEYQQAARIVSGLSMKHILELGKSSSNFLVGKFSSTVLFVCLVLVACHEKGHVERPIPSQETLGQWAEQAYRLNISDIKRQLALLVRADRDTLVADSRTRRYYRDGGNLLWIDRFGLDKRADSLLAYLNTVEEMGFSKRVFVVEQIERDLQRIRTLDVDSGIRNVNRVMARLEYNLTKAFLRYTAGQHFGFTNPTRIFNNLDIREQDSVRTTYRGLFDIHVKRPTKDFYTTALRKVYNDSVDIFLRQAQPQNALYALLIKHFKGKDLSEADRIRLLCNVERSRWRQTDYPQNHRKYVLVNVPSYHLDAIEGDSVLTMRMACGTLDTKTPLLNSHIMRMDVNPQWIIPRSIIKKEVVGHAGNPDYFERHRYFILNRSSGRRIDPANVSAGMLLNPDYFVIQEGGEGNSLGRVVFRFNNNFSIFIHDTSSKWAFDRGSRSVSHGCIRVQKPFELAVFLLNKKDGTLIDKIKYSMQADLSKPKEGEEKRTRVDYRRLVNSVKVNPNVPLFITYYTLYPDVKGKMHTYADVYGYDKVLYRYLRSFSI
jgi:peptidoglycan binding protein